MSQKILWGFGRSAVAADVNASPGTVPTQPPRENGAAEHSEGTILTGAPPGNFVAAVEEDHAAVAEDAICTLESFQKFGELKPPTGNTV